MTPDANMCAIHYFIGDDDTVDLEHTTAEVRTVIQELPDHSAMHNILLDSGADASVFPMCFASAGEPSYTGNMKLHDAQGKQIPVAGMRDVEIALLDEHGHLVTFRERGAVSPGVSQPIICFGKLLENGWGVDGIDQTLNHASSGTKIPIELQNKSMVVRGWVRAMGTEPQLQPEVPTSIRAVKASVLPSPVKYKSLFTHTLNYTPRNTATQNDSSSTHAHEPKCKTAEPVKHLANKHVIVAPPINGHLFGKRSVEKRFSFRDKKMRP